MSHFDQVPNYEYGRRARAVGPYGPVYDEKLDGARLNRQRERIRDWMLARSGWNTLDEIRNALGYPEPSISAQLRHLRKPQFGRYRVWKRRRTGRKGTWEYRVLQPENPATPSLFDELRQGSTR